MAKEKFYMCYVEGGNSPTYKHFTLEGATTEAKLVSLSTTFQENHMRSIREHALHNL